jgi:uncharacterized protein (DUF1778 family)
MATTKAPRRSPKAEPIRRKEVRKEDQIRIRVTAEQKMLLTEAAEKAGAGLSSWLLIVSLREARKLLNI